MLKFNKSVVFLYAIFFLEICFYTFGKNWLPSTINSIFNTFLSCLLLYLAFYLFQKENNTPKTEIRLGLTQKVYYLFFFLVALFSIVFFNSLFNSTPIDIVVSDIIPTTQNVYVSRFINNEFVYTPIDKGTYSWTPNYFPMHWMPFVGAELMNIDYRLLALIVLILSFLYYTIKAIETSNHQLNIFIKISLPFFVLFSFFIDDKVIIEHTIETLISAYYLFFAVALLYGNTISKSVGLSSILMSRYSIVLWTPFYIYSNFIKHKKQTIILSALCLLFALALFIIPYISKYPGLLTDSFGAFIPVYIQEWKGQAWQQPGDNPYQLFNGLGFASYYYLYWPGTLVDKIESFVKLQTIINILLPLLSLWFFIKNKTKIKPEQIQLITLKICLIGFYAFIVVPYHYLFMVSLFVSIPIVMNFNLAKR
jgi:hypothetical protein